MTTQLYFLHTPTETNLLKEELVASLVSTYYPSVGDTIKIKASEYLVETKHFDIDGNNLIYCVKHLKFLGY